MQIHLHNKTVRGTVNTLWHAIQSGYTCMESLDQTCQTEPCISDSEAAAAPWSDPGPPPPPSLCPQC